MTMMKNLTKLKAKTWKEWQRMTKNKGANQQHIGKPNNNQPINQIQHQDREVWALTKCGHRPIPSQKN